MRETTQKFTKRREVVSLGLPIKFVVFHWRATHFGTTLRPQSVDHGRTTAADVLDSRLLDGHHGTASEFRIDRGRADGKCAGLVGAVRNSLLLLDSRRTWNSGFGRRGL